MVSFLCEYITLFARVTTARGAKGQDEKKVIGSPTSSNIFSNTPFQKLIYRADWRKIYFC